MQVLSLGVETVPGCGWEMGSSRPGYKIWGLARLEELQIYNNYVFQRILCRQEMDISVMHDYVKNTTANE